MVVDIFLRKSRCMLLVKPRATKITANFFNKVKAALRVPAFAPALA